MAMLLQKADVMFPEGQGAPRAMTKDGAAAEKSNELLVNAKEAVDEFWKQRGYDPKKPELTKARLGYALDKEETVGYVVTGAMNLPRLSPDEARAIGKRVVALVGASGTVGCKLKALKKRGKAAAPQIAALLQAESTLSLEPPPRKGTSAPPPPPPPPPPIPTPLPPMEEPCTRATAAAATPLQRLYGMPHAAAWGPDEADLPDDPQPVSPGAPAAARAALSEPWLQSREAAHAIIAACDLEDQYENLNDGCTEVEGTPMR